MYLLTKWFGAFLIGEDGQVVAHRTFPKEPEAIAKRLKAMEDGELLSEERELVRTHVPKSFSVFERRLEKLGGVLVEERAFDLSGYALDKGILHGSMVALSKRKLRTQVRDDEHISRAVASLDEQTRAVNLILGHLRDWYALHCPELEKVVSRDEFVSLVAEKGDRASIGLVEDSVGAEIGEEEKEALMALGSLVRETDLSISALRRYIEKKASKVAPNLSHLAGPLVGARLMACAGGVERLARMPASTVQLLGAEKALFKHIKNGKRPPKHGIIFQHPLVHQAPRALRGKIARTFASKICIAARADFYSGNFIAGDLKRALDKAVGSMTGEQRL